MRLRFDNQNLVESTDITAFITLTQNENLTTFFVVGDYKKALNYEAVKEILLGIGINLDYAKADYAWIEENNEIVSISLNNDAFLWYRELENDDNIMVYQKDNLIANYNNLEQSVVEDGLNIMVYDKVTKELVENVGFECSGANIQYGKTNTEKSHM